jgi:hypothetical protein
MPDTSLPLRGARTGLGCPGRLPQAPVETGLRPRSSGGRDPIQGGSTEAEGVCPTHSWPRSGEQAERDPPQLLQRGKVRGGVFGIRVAFMCWSYCRLRRGRGQDVQPNHCFRCGAGATVYRVCSTPQKRRPDRRIQR